MIRGDLAGILERMREGVKGELVLVIEGMAESANDDWQAEAEEMSRQGMSVKDIVRKFEGRASKNEVKKFVMSRTEKQSV